MVRRAEGPGNNIPPINIDAPIVSGTVGNNQQKAPVVNSNAAKAISKAVNRLFPFLSPPASETLIASTLGIPNEGTEPREISPA